MSENERLEGREQDGAEEGAEGAELSLRIKEEYLLSQYDAIRQKKRTPEGVRDDMDVDLEEFNNSNNVA